MPGLERAQLGNVREVLAEQPVEPAVLGPGERHLHRRRRADNYQLVRLRHVAAQHAARADDRSVGHLHRPDRAALTAEESQDGLILETVSDIENLTTGMPRKIWQEITLLSST